MATYSFRDCIQWKNEGLKLSTDSNEACKLFDVVLNQYVSWREDEKYGGFVGSLEKLKAADPNFVMGHVLAIGLDLIGTGRSPTLDLQFKNDIDKLIKLSKTALITNRERQHVEALELWANGRLTDAADVWENILVSHPNDMLAIKCAHDSYFYMGQAVPMRDSIARVFSSWKPSYPHYGYIYGMYGFGLEENNLYEKAEIMARKGLEINREDAWCTHTLAHVWEMTGQQNTGIDFLERTSQDWSPSKMLACHNYWHLALYYIEKGMHEEGLTVYDSYIDPVHTSGSLLDIVDSASLLYRMELEGVNVGDRWKRIYQLCASHVDDNILVFNNIHFLMSYLGAEDKNFSDKLMDNMKAFSDTWDKTDQGKVAKTIGTDVCRAFIEYKNENFAETVNILYPLRYKIITMGGSHAQRDLFNLLLINAALKSSNVKHHKLAKILLAERKALKDNSPLTDRLISRGLAMHCDV